MADESSFNNIENEELEKQQKQANCNETNQDQQVDQHLTVEKATEAACYQLDELDQPGKETCWRPFRTEIWRNPESWKTWKIPDKFEFVTQVKMKSSADKSNIPKSIKELDQSLPVVEVNFEKLRNPPEEALQVMWIGHASVLVQFDGISILCDPVFSEHIGPSLMLSKLPNPLLDRLTCKRYRKAPCKVKDLPKVDVVLISHDHFDHLDYPSIVDITGVFPHCKFVVPMGIKDWLIKSMPRFPPDNIKELKWWETQEMVLHKDGKWAFGRDKTETPTKSMDSEGMSMDSKGMSMDSEGMGTVSIHCAPAQHWCQRGITDLNTRLWCSWAVQGPKHNFFFGGDTGYCDVFKKIGRKYGPFTLATLPIGAYEPRSYMHPQHVSPEQAVDIHEDIKAKFSLGIHWGTFKQMGCYEYYLEPPELVKERLIQKGLESDSFCVINHGEIRQFPDNTEDYKEEKDHNAEF